MLKYEIVEQEIIEYDKIWFHLDVCNNLSVNISGNLCEFSQMESLLLQQCKSRRALIYAVHWSHYQNMQLNAKTQSTDDYLV